MTGDDFEKYKGNCVLMLLSKNEASEKLSN